METDKDHIPFLLSYDTMDRVCDIVKIVNNPLSLAKVWFVFIETVYE